MKPGIVRLRTMYEAPFHAVTRQLGSALSKDLRQKYHQRSIRVIEGDTIKVLRGEFKGIEGKVTNVSTTKRGIAVEGIKREKLKGGNVDIYIHPSNVIVTALNLEDKWRQNRLEGQKTKVAKPETTSENKSVEKPKIQKETKSKDTKKTAEKIQTKENKSNDKSDKKEKPKPKKTKENDK